ncbi:MAG: ABC transporter permease [Alphaproteobacteria bacterium]
MSDNPLRIALKLLLSPESGLHEIITLSVLVSGSALLLSCLIGIPLGAALAIGKWRGRNIVQLLVSVAMGLPPVVVGLVLYLLLSRQGPLGWLTLLYTPNAMILAQTILATPIVAGFTAECLKAANHQYGELLQSLALTPRAAFATLLFEARLGLITAALAGFGRAISEVGAVLVVGGNIAHETRIMTTAITLETSRGELSNALALGIVLLLLSLLVNLLLFSLRAKLR